MVRKVGRMAWSSQRRNWMTPSVDSSGISEFDHHPADITASGGRAGFVEDDFEFLEVTNFGASPVSLEGVRIEGGVQFSFGGVEPRSWPRVGAGWW